MQADARSVDSGARRALRAHHDSPLRPHGAWPRLRSMLRPHWRAYERKRRAAAVRAALAVLDERDLQAVVRRRIGVPFAAMQAGACQELVRRRNKAATPCFAPDIGPIPRLSKLHHMA